MIRIIKQIFSRIPKKGIASIVSPFLGILANRLYDSYVLQTGFVGWPRVLPVLVWSGALLATYFLLAFIFQSIRLASELSTQAQIASQNPQDTRRELPVSEVGIGTFKDSLLAIDILAKVVLGERSKPSIEVFLKRIVLGEPYCPNCSRTLDTTHASWRADGVQIGYACSNCKREREGKKLDLYKDVQGQVRRNFDAYWQTYTEAVDRLTGGKPEEFKVT
jgi:hypothetical protein